MARNVAVYDRTAGHGVSRLHLLLLVANQEDAVHENRFHFPRPLRRSDPERHAFGQLLRPQIEHAITFPDRLLDAHLEQFNGLSEYQAKIAAATARLDRVQHGHDRAPTASTVIQKSLGR